MARRRGVRDYAESDCAIAPLSLPPSATVEGLMGSGLFFYPVKNDRDSAEPLNRLTAPVSS